MNKDISYEQVAIAGKLSQDELERFYSKKDRSYDIVIDLNGYIHKRLSFGNFRGFNFGNNRRSYWSYTTSPY